MGFERENPGVPFPPELECICPHCGSPMIDETGLRSRIAYQQWIWKATLARYDCRETPNRWRRCNLQSSTFTSPNVDDGP